MSRLGFLTYLVLGLAAGAGPGEKTGDPPVRLNPVEKEIVDLTNAERTRRDLKPLTLSPTLVAVARAYAKAMADAGELSHDVGGSFPERLKKSGYAYSRAGENIASGQSSAQEVVNDWMNSPGHRENILNPEFTEFGVGTAKRDDTPYYCQEFGTPRGSAAGEKPKGRTSGITIGAARGGDQ